MICEPVHNLIHRTKLSVAGASLQGERFPQDQQSEWVRSSDPWFRPVRVETGPDGAVWFADMYRLVIEHPQWIPEAWQQRIDLRGGADKGRIYRIRHRDTPSNSLPILDVNNHESILAALQSEIGPLRDLAQQWIIQNRPEVLRTKIASAMLVQKEPRIRIQLLATMDCCGWLDDSLLSDRIMKEESSRVIQFSLEIARTRWDQATTLREAVLQVSSEKIDNELAMHMILLLGMDSSKQASETIVRAVKNREHDPWIQRSLRLALPIHQRAVIADLSDRLLDEGRSLSESLEESQGNVLQFVGQLLKESPEPLLETDQIAEWVQKASNASYRSFAMLPLVAAWLETKEPTDTSVPASVLAWIEASHGIVENEAMPVDQRAAAVHLMGWSNSGTERLEGWLKCFASNLPLLVQETALDRILESPTEDSIESVLSKWDRLTPALRLQLSSRLLQKPEWTLRFLDSIEKQTVRASDIDASSVQSMLNTWDRSIQTRAVQLFGGSPNRNRTELVERTIEQITSIKNDAVEEDLDAGRKLYLQHCSVCHEAKDNTPALGPNLSSLSDRSVRNLVIGILDPNRAIDGKYKQYLVRTQAGESLSGVLVQESASSLTIATADGKRQVLERGNIDELKGQELSLMPEGFERQLSTEAMRQLIVYLQTGEGPKH